MFSAEPKAEVDNTYGDFDYLGYHKKSNLIIVLLYIVLKKKMTNTLSQGTWIDVVIWSHTLCAQPTDKSVIH